MTTIKTTRFALFSLSLVLLLSSCFGVSADITLNADGSGTIALEYRISASLDALGRLDGNERWNTIPVGQADFQRTLDRLPGMRLVSFSSREDGRDFVASAKMEFSDIQSLLAFLDASGSRSAFSGNAASGRLALTLNDGAQIQNAELTKLLAEAAGDYSVSFSMTFPGEGTLAVSDKQGRPLAAIPGSQIQPSGKKVFCSFPLFQTLTAPEGLIAEFNW